MWIKRHKHSRSNEVTVDVFFCFFFFSLARLLLQPLRDRRRVSGEFTGVFWWLSKRNERSLNPGGRWLILRKRSFVGSQTNCLPSDPTGYNGAYMDGWRHGNSVCSALDTAEMHMDGREEKLQLCHRRTRNLRLVIAAFSLSPWVQYVAKKTCFFLFFFFASLNTF